MSSSDSAARVERERAYHDARYASSRTRRRAGKYYAVASSPDVYRSRLEVPAGTRVLEYGCGTGSAAFALAAAGAQVTAIDISPVAVTAAKAQAAAEGVTIDVLEMNAEHLDLPDDAFDLVCGSGILHHLALDAAFAEVARVLAPGGRAVFLEPMGHNPAINLYRRLTPRMRTPDEHPLRMSDLAMAADAFGSVDAEFFELTSILAAPFARLPGGAALARALRRVDHALLTRISFLRRYSWTVVLELSAAP